MEFMARKKYLRLTDKYESFWKIGDGSKTMTLEQKQGTLI
jgi:hypothetical protein